MRKEWQKRLIRQSLALATAGIISASFGMSQADAADVKVLPIDRAKFLAGQRFDFEVEVKGNTPVQQMEIMVNGIPAEKFFGKKMTVANEKGVTSYKISDVNFDKTGNFTVIAKAVDGEGSDTKKAAYEVVCEKAPKIAKNVVLFVGDGMGSQARQVARILSKGITEGKYNGQLAMDDMPYSARITTSGYDSLVTDSANSASAYATGHKAVVNAMGSYANSTPDPFDDPKVENIIELVKRTKGMSTALITGSNVLDATPAAMFTHTRRRAEQNWIAVDMMADYHRPDVVLGGGSRNFIPSNVAGSKRKDDRNVANEFKGLGYSVVGNKTDLMSLKNPDKILGLFTLDTMNVYIDREIIKNPKVLGSFTDQPSLMDMTKKTLEVLDKNPNGFFAMIEGASIDKQLHILDWHRAAYDTIELDKAVQMVKDYSKKNGDNTLIIVVADHSHGMSITGTYHERDGKTGREAVRVYEQAGWTNFVDADGDGFPDDPNPEVTLAVQWANHPDYYENYRFLSEPTPPALKAGDKSIANPKRSPLGKDGVYLTGNIPNSDPQEVHSADDVILTAEGPGAEYFRGVMDNTEVFYGMVRALGIDGRKNITKK